MTSVSCETIYEMFLGNIRDNKLLSGEYSTAETFMQEWLKKAISKPYVRRLFSTLTMDEDSLSFDLKHAVNEEADADFIVEVLAQGMVIAWLYPKVYSGTNIAQMFGGKEQKFYSQATHLAELRGLLEDVIISQRKLIQDRGFISNPYLEGNK